MLDSPEPTGAQKARRSIVDSKNHQKTAVQDPATSPIPHTDLRACLCKAQVPGLNLSDEQSWKMRGPQVTQGGLAVSCASRSLEGIGALQEMNKGAVRDTSFSVSLPPGSTGCLRLFIVTRKAEVRACFLVEVHICSISWDGLIDL